MFGAEERDWTLIKGELDRHLDRLYIKGTKTLAEPSELSTELVIISSFKVNLAILSAELTNAAEKRKSQVYKKEIASSNATRANAECRLDGYYLDLKLQADKISGYLKEVSALVSAVQSYLRFKGLELSNL